MNQISESNLYVARNNKQREMIIEYIKNYRLPFSAFIQSIYPKRSINMNAYLWGIVYKYISDYTGEEPEKLHEIYKERFNVKWFPHSFKECAEWYSLIQGTSNQDEKDFKEFIEKVCADASIFLQVAIPLPNEVPFGEYKMHIKP